MDSSQWFNYHKGVIDIFVYGLAVLHATIEIVTHTDEFNRYKESAKKIDMGTYLKAAIAASFITGLTSIFVGNRK